MLGLLGRGAVEGGVTGAAEQSRRGVHDRELSGIVRIEPAQVGAVGFVLEPGDAEGCGTGAESGDGVRVGVGHRAEDADSGVEHHLCRGHSGQQRHLRVSALDGERGAALDAVPVVDGNDLLVGKREARSAALGLTGSQMDDRGHVCDGVAEHDAPGGALDVEAATGHGADPTRLLRLRRIDQPQEPGRR